MANFNKVILIGRLTRDPESRTFSNGNKVAKFGFAVSRNKKNPQTGQWENDPNPLFIDCEAFTRDNFTRLHDVVMNYCRKGSQIMVEGQLRLDTWDDKTTGQKRSVHKIALDEIQLLDGKPQDGQGDQSHGDDEGGFQRSSAPARSAPPRNAPANTRPGGGSQRDDDGPPPGGDEIPF